MKWIVVSQRPVQVDVIENGKVTSKVLSNKSGPFVPVVNMAFTKLRNQGFFARFQDGSDTPAAKQPEQGPSAPAVEAVEPVADAPAIVDVVAPQEAVEAADEAVEEQPVVEEVEEALIGLSETTDDVIESLGLSERVTNILKSEGLVTRRELEQMLNDGLLSSIDGIGASSLKEIKAALGK